MKSKKELIKARYNYWLAYEWYVKQLAYYEAVDRQEFIESKRKWAEYMVTKAYEEAHPQLLSSLYYIPRMPRLTWGTNIPRPMLPQAVSAL